MPVAGHVIALAPGGAASVVEALGLLPGIEVGSPQGGRLPIVTLTADDGEEKDLVRRIEEIPGVESVTLVYYNFEDVEDPGARRAGRGGKAHR